MKDSALAMVVFVILGVILAVVYFMMASPQSILAPPQNGERVSLCNLLKWYNEIPGYNACNLDFGGRWVCTDDEIGCYETMIPIDCGHPAIDVFFNQCVEVGAGAGCNSEQLYCMYND